MLMIYGSNAGCTQKASEMSDRVKLFGYVDQDGLRTQG
jgi:hypothetical protein